MSGASFNATTSKLEQAAFVGMNVAQISLVNCGYALSQGEANFGRILTAPPIVSTGNGGIVFGHNNSANTYFFSYLFGPAGTTCAWTFPVTDGQYNRVVLTYDRGSPLNDPLAWVNGSSVTVTNIARVGTTAIALAAGFTIGNRGAQDRTWDGGLEHLLAYSGLLSAADGEKASLYPGSIVTNGIFWAPMANGAYVKILVPSGGAWVDSGVNGSATALSTFTTASPLVESV